MSVLFTLGVVAVSIGWYHSCARPRVSRDGAMFHVFERLGQRRFSGLEPEMRQILKEKGLREGNPFEQLVAGAPVIDREGGVSFEEIAGEVAADLAPLLPAEPQEEPVRAAFFLVSPEAEAIRHLRLLSQFAGRADDEDFMELWLAASDEQELKEAVLRSERYLSLRVRPGAPTESLIGRPLGEIRMPEGSLVALIHREGTVLVPRGGTEVRAGDRLTVIGDPETIRLLQRRWGEDRRDDA